MNQPEFAIGETVLWRGNHGDAPEKKATVIGCGQKDDRPVYDLDNGHWAFEDQLRHDEHTAC